MWNFYVPPNTFEPTNYISMELWIFKIFLVCHKAPGYFLRASLYVSHHNFLVISWSVELQLLWHLHSTYQLSVWIFKIFLVSHKASSYIPRASLYVSMYLCFQLTHKVSSYFLELLQRSFIKFFGPLMMCQATTLSTFHM